MDEKFSADGAKGSARSEQFEKTKEAFELRNSVIDPSDPKVVDDDGRRARQTYKLLNKNEVRSSTLKNYLLEKYGSVSVRGLREFQREGFYKYLLAGGDCIIRNDVPDSDKPLSIKERNNLLRTIKGLCLVLMGSAKGGKYRKGDDPNLTQLGKAVHDALLFNEMPVQGQSEANLKKVIAEALNVD